MAALFTASSSGDRDKNTLFVKNLPGNCTVKHMKALTSDVKQVRLRTTFAVIDGKRTRIGFGYLEYASEAAAEKNYKILENAVIKGKRITVDYVGPKSSFYSNKLKTELCEKDIDPLRLYIRGLPTNATDDDLRILFPEATEFVLPKRKRDKKLFGYGFVGFATAELAQKYHDNSKDLKLKGNELNVLYAKRRSKNDRSAKQWGRKKDNGPSAKKVKKDQVEKDDDDDDNIHNEEDVDEEDVDEDDDNDENDEDDENGEDEEDQ